MCLFVSVGPKQKGQGNDGATHFLLRLSEVSSLILFANYGVNFTFRGVPVAQMVFAQDCGASPPLGDCIEI